MSETNPHLAQRLAAIQQSLMAHHAGGKGLPTAVGGEERETFIREFLQKVFPSHYRFTHGVITDSFGKLSGQVDLAVEYPFLPSFPMPNADQRLLLAESVATIIEVKSNLASQWSELETTVKKVKMLQRKWRGSISHSGGGLSVHDSSVTPIPCIAVGYTGHKTLEGLKNRVLSTTEDARPDAAYVIESGCFYSHSVGPFVQTQNPALALYALCIVLWSLTVSVATTGVDLMSYVQTTEGIA